MAVHSFLDWFLFLLYNSVRGIPPTASRMNKRSSPARALLITGTDTGCGKTFVTAALARLMRQQGRRVVVCKPVATGAEWVNGRWLSEDTRRLAMAGETVPEQVTFWAFPQPAAPPVAARLAGETLSLAAMALAVRRLFEPHTLTLIEGIGGLLCPLTEKETVADLAAVLRVPLLVVARHWLGTLNHTLLTLEVARSGIGGGWPDRDGNNTEAGPGRGNLHRGVGAPD